MFLRDMIVCSDFFDQFCMVNVGVMLTEFQRFLHCLLHFFRYSKRIDIYGKIQFYFILINVSTVYDRTHFLFSSLV